MRFVPRRIMSEAMGKAEAGATGAVTGEVQKQSIMAAISKLLTWSPTSREEIIKSEKELLTLVK